MGFGFISLQPLEMGTDLVGFGTEGLHGGLVGVVLVLPKSLGGTIRVDIEALNQLCHTLELFG